MTVPTSDTSSAKDLERRQPIGLFARSVSALLSVPIHFYRLVLSPLMPPSCRFQPTCSAYALEALRVHGPISGTWLAVRRVSSCHPIEWLGGRSGYDPVPPRVSSGEVRDKSSG